MLPLVVVVIIVVIIGVVVIIVIIIVAVVTSCYGSYHTCHFCMSIACVLPRHPKGAIRTRCRLMTFLSSITELKDKFQRRRGHEVCAVLCWVHTLNYYPKLAYYFLLGIQLCDVSLVL